MKLVQLFFAVCLLVFPAARTCSPRSLNAGSSDKPAIDADIPAGNIVFERMSNDTVFVHQDLRDTEGDWFYWAFRARGFQGRTVTFIFTKSVAIGVRGPVVSLDLGKTYDYADARDVTHNKFTYTFPEDAYEVWMYECFPYTPEMWTSFVKGIPASVKHETGTLCQSRNGAAVPYFHIGEGKYKVVMTSRHHCSENTGTYVLEGVAAAFAEKSELGGRLRSTIDLTIVPFVDYDGAVAGDQGKNRKPHDHCRDYTEFIYPETRAVAQLIRDIAPAICIDAHSPWLYGHNNEFIYSPLQDPAILHNPAKEDLFASLLEKNQEGGLRYKTSDDLPFGESWNTSANYTQGPTMIMWALMNIPSLEIGRSLEIPFANANGATVTQSSMIQFGHGLAKTLLDIANAE